MRKKLLAAVFVFLLPVGILLSQDAGYAPPPSALAGEWLGNLAAGGARLRIVFHVVEKDGGLAATMDSPDQGARGIPVGAVSLKGSAVVFELKQLGGRYEGKLDPSGEKIEGYWSQGGQKFPLALARQASAPSTAQPQAQLPAPTAGLNRPQEPRPPFPYRSEDVVILSDGGIELAGSLVLPQGTGPFPAAVLVTGSGQQDRDETIFGHKPFLVLADYLARRGFATLRWDDRGAGGSGGDFSASTSFDFAYDAAAALAFLKGRKEIDASKLGIIGHSEGGIIAAMLSAREPGLAFAVLLAGPGLPGEEILYLQNAAIARASGLSEAAIAGANAKNAQLYAIALGLQEPEAKRAEIRAFFRAMAPPLSAPAMIQTLEAQGDSTADQLLSPWFQCFLTFDPAPYLAQAKVPVLALIGSKDLQVPAKENLAAIEEALGESGTKGWTALELEGLNHLFQRAATGLPEEYGTIEETMAPQALAAVGDWLEMLLR